MLCQFGDLVEHYCHGCARALQLFIAVASTSTVTEGVRDRGQARPPFRHVALKIPSARAFSWTNSSDMKIALLRSAGPGGKPTSRDARARGLSERGSLARPCCISLSALCALVYPAAFGKSRHRAWTGEQYLWAREKQRITNSFPH